MFQRGVGLSLLAALSVLLISIGVDVRSLLSVDPIFSSASPGKPAFMPIGPRRYPPGYRKKAAAFMLPDTRASDERYQTVMTN